MVIGFFLTVFYTFISFFVNILPTIAFPTGISDAILAIWYYINAYAYIFPVVTLLQVLGIAFIFHGAVLLWRLSHLGARYLRGR